MDKIGATSFSRSLKNFSVHRKYLGQGHIQDFSTGGGWTQLFRGENGRFYTDKKQRRRRIFI